MAKILKRVRKDDMLHYIDDILIGSNSLDGVHEKLARVLQVLKECGLTLNIDKCELYKQTTTFLGHQIHPKGISAGEINTNAISLFAEPSNVNEVR